MPKHVREAITDDFIDSCRLISKQPVSHNNAPDTSHKAEDEITKDGTRARLQHRVAELVRRKPGFTALELYTYYVHPKVPSIQISTLRARLTELTNIKVEHGNKRKCHISGKTAVTWYPKSDCLSAPE